MFYHFLPKLFSLATSCHPRLVRAAAAGDATISLACELGALEAFGIRSDLLGVGSPIVVLGRDRL